MNNDLELQRALRSFYRAKSLSSARLEYLIQAKTRALLPTRRWPAIHLMPITALGVACAVCLFLGARQEQQRATERAVCAEVVMNYEKHSPMQVLSSHYSDVQAALNRLDFSIMPANSRILEAYRLVGGRYCSIQGVPAAQLRVQDIRSGQECTLYAVKAVGTLQDVNSTIDHMDGVRVEVWRQDNVLFVLAGRTD
jgi:anti-sigma factor RsiW